MPDRAAAVGVDPAADAAWQDRLAWLHMQLSACQRGDWAAVHALMARRPPVVAPCPAAYRDEYWGLHQEVRERLSARLAALEAEIRRVAPSGRREASVPPMAVDRRA